MDTPLRSRARNRMLATELLRDLTLMTAVGGLAATAGFGWLASMTYAGAPATGTSGTDVTTAGDPVAPAARNPVPKAVATPRPGTGSSGSSSGGSSSSGVSGSRRQAHVSTGGS